MNAEIILSGHITIFTQKENEENTMGSAVKLVFQNGLLVEIVSLDDQLDQE